MMSNLDRVRSLSYCFGLQLAKRGIENILNGREYDDDGDEMSKLFKQNYKKI